MVRKQNKNTSADVVITYQSIITISINTVLVTFSDLRRISHSSLSEMDKRKKHKPAESLAMYKKTHKKNTEYPKQTCLFSIFILFGQNEKEKR